MYGPVFLYLFGASAEEDHVSMTWSVSKFERYAAAADQLLEMKGR